MIFKAGKKKVNMPIRIKIKDKNIEKVKSTKFLGIRIDEHMTWKTHISYITNKTSKLSGIVAKLRHYLDIKTLRNIYYTMIYPYLTYCNIVWGSNYCTRLKSLHKVQKKIVRLMTFSKFKESTKPIFKELKLLDLFELNTFLVSLFMYSQRTNTLPKIFKNYFLQNDDLHQYNTRSAKNLHVEYHRTNYGKFSLKAKGTKIWNDLPDDVKKSNSFSIFKRKMKMILFNT